MSLDKNQLKDLIEKVLNLLGMHSDAAVNLLLGTAAQESHLGTYIKQIGSGPALGVFQMEPDTEKDIWNNYIYFRPEIENLVAEIAHVAEPNSLHLHGNLVYQIVMARIHYRRKSNPFPSANDELGLAAYWKNHYNTPKGKGTVEEFVHNYRKYVKEI
ncbi:MAG: hypothetical protein H8D96_09290 [Desulfobacterales bacterium]|uniref:Uncharacterized protein n=1 Tax=Candidatus Desulfatibia vada TaxID=2841696 RepID=A0A8J6P318_9BACT|nr:hypothetical protein [Candidatus Desulfatibia vada]